MANYFPHDEDSQHDPKIIRLLRVKGMKGYGIYWCLIEMLHAQDGSLKLMEVADISYSLRVEEVEILSIINDFDLFKTTEIEFFSERVIENLSERKSKSNKAKESAARKWEKFRAEKQAKNANAMRTHNERYAINKEINKQTLREGAGESVFDLSFCDLKLKPVFEKWLGYRLAIGKPYKIQQAIEACYRELREKSNNNSVQAEKIVNYTMSGQWENLVYPDKKQTSTHNNQPVN